VPDGEESGISGPISSIKMYSYVQYAMQKNQCVVETCLAHMEQEPDPPLLSPLVRAGCLSPLQGADCLSPFSPWGGGGTPFSYLPGHWRFNLLVAPNKDGPGQCSGHSQAA
jgi:hypothetical protein